MRGVLPFPVRATTLVIGLAVSVSATSYYFNAITGDDNLNTGRTTASPWKTLSKANTLDLNAGDSVLLRGGQTFNGTISYGAGDEGEPGRPVVLGSYGGGRATIEAGNSGAVYWENCGNIIIRDLIVRGSGPGVNEGSGVCIANAIDGGVKKQNVRIEHVSASGFGMSIDANGWGSSGCGIMIASWPNDGGYGGFRNVVVEACTTYSNEFMGILVSGVWNDIQTDYSHEDIVIRGCIMYDNQGRSSYTVNWSGGGVLVGETRGALVEYCVAYNNGANNPPSAPGGPIGIWAATSRDVVIQYCESYNNRSNGYDGGGFDLDGGVINGTIQYCYSHGNKGAGYLLYIYDGSPWYNDSLTVRYCVSENDGANTSYGGVTIMQHGSQPMRNVFVYNNTLYQSADASRSCIKFDGGGGTTATRIHNNLLVSAGAALIDVSSEAGRCAVQGNGYYSSGTFRIRDDGTVYSGLAAWRTASSHERLNNANVGVQGNPLLGSALGTGVIVGDARQLNTLTAYKLQSGSPMINAGLNLQSVFGQPSGPNDFFGTTVPQDASFDIGCSEFKPSTRANVTSDGRAVTGAAHAPVTVALDGRKMNGAWSRNTRGGRPAARALGATGSGEIIVRE